MSTQYPEEVQQSLQTLGLLPTYANMPLYKRFNSPHGGLGLRATRDIPFGTPIISEPELFSKIESRKVTRAQANLAGFAELSCPGPLQTPDARFKANSFEMGKDRKSKNKEGIFLEPSRLNHSCVPNAYFTWNNISKRITVHASDNIPRGEEIFVNYNNKVYHHTRDERREELLTDYHFDCTCRACEPNTEFGRASQDRRRQMHELEGNIDRIENSNIPTDRKALLVNIQAYISLLKTEGLLYPQLADLYDKEVRWYKVEMEQAASGAVHDIYWAKCLEDALRAARDKLRLDIACNGHDSSEVEKTLELIEQLRQSDRPVVEEVVERRVNPHRIARR